MSDPVSRLLLRRAGGHGPVMLMYHSVAAGSGRPDWPWAVSMQQFRAQMDILQAGGWATPTMCELLAEPSRWQGRVAVITFDDGYADNLAAFDLLRERQMRATCFIVTGSIGEAPRWSSTNRPPLTLLDRSQLRALAESGIEIGSHTVNHLRLPALDDDALANELRDSRAALEDITGAQVRSFAYPYGAWDARCAAAVRDAGYAGACTTRTGWALRDGDPYSLRRLTLYNSDNSGSFMRKLAAGTNDVGWPATMRRLLHRKG